MTTDHHEQIEHLESQIQQVAPQDTMAEAGRKVLLKEFVRMLKHEAGSRTGEDLEDVHQMRVSTRRIRSTLRLLRRYYRARALSRYRRRLRKVARALGAVRDLDVLIADLSQFQTALDAEQQAGLKTAIERFEQKRAAARADLISIFDGKAYRRFVSDFGEFLTTPGAGAKTLHSDDIVPVQLRHVLPGMIHDCLAAVLAYDAVVGDADAERLHGLRIEFKRLRYIVALFDEVLGSQMADFVEELKAIQDHLGRLNDIAIAHQHLDALVAGRDGYVPSAMQAYSERLDAEAADLLAKFPVVWSRFNSRKVQSKLSSGLLALR
jgi:CHAD domain-containing protein